LYDKAREQQEDRKFIHSHQWRMIRQIKLSSFPLCERCLLNNKEIVAVLVHHLDKNEFNNNNENLESLCFGCHEKEHGKERFKRKQH